jgi:hypothetical protein
MKDELQKLWSSEKPRTLSTEEKEMLFRQAGEKLAKLDRMLQGRQYREILAAVLVAAMFGAQFAAASGLFAKLGSAVIIAGCVWVTYYLLRHGRGPQNPYSGAPLEEYRAGVVAKFDHQIRLLSRVKYWYVLPFYLGIVLLGLGDAERNGWTMRPFDWYVLGGATAFCAFVVWLNEVWGVKRLRKERDVITAMLEG